MVMMLRKYKYSVILFSYISLVLVLPKLFNSPANQTELNTFLMLFCLAHGMVCIIAFISLHSQIILGLKDIRNKPLKFIQLFIVGLLLLYLGVMFIDPLVDSFANSSNQSSVNHVLQIAQGMMLFIFLFPVVLLGPVNEEIIFREIILKKLKTKIGVYFSIGISSFLFGLLHVHSFSEIVQVIPYFYSGLIFGVIYYKSNFNIVYSITLHIFNNCIAMLFAL
ncbi:CPBP family intramembrane glutamic endopeptidase [Lysinibacillus sphaericus]